MSRVLFLLPSVPWPLDAGARIRNAGLLSLVGSEHEVDALAFGPPGAQADLARLVRRAQVIGEPPGRGLVRRARDLATSTLPDMAWRHWSPSFTATLRRWIVEGRYGAVQAEGIEMARYLFAIPPASRVYDAHNAEFLLQRRVSTSASTASARLYSRLQWRRLERFERTIVRGSRMTLAVSHHDANQLLALAAGAADVRVVPNGIDLSRYPFASPTLLADRASRNVLFLGKLDFRPNAEAVRWFVDEVLEPLKDVRLFAVGAAPPAWLVEAGQHDDRVAVTGYVADERAYLARCAALVLPFQSGGGSRLKALIAMASGLPIVSTRVGMEGLEAEPDVHFLQADSPADWVATVRRLLGDAALRQRLAHRGRQLVEQRYAWPALRADARAAYAWLGP